MFSASLDKWYTDVARISRGSNNTSSGYVTQVRNTVADNVMCRAYSNVKQHLKPEDASYVLHKVNSIAFPVGTNVCVGDEILLTRGAGVGKPQKPVRYVAGSVTAFVEPFGGIVAFLEHIEVQVSAAIIADEEGAS